jgi:predicted metal-dependent hydrolase
VNVSHQPTGAALPTPLSEPARTEAALAAYADCFNGQRFFEAHEVLEEVWLPQRASFSAAFLKGLIQLAGAFVHLQRHGAKYPRLRPAAALLKLAHSNLAPFQPQFAGLEVTPLLELIDHWQAELGRHDGTVNPWTPARSPRLRSRSSGSVP